MPDLTAEIDIDPWEYVRECSRREIKELIEALKEEVGAKVLIDDDADNVLDITYKEALGKLYSKRIYLTLEEEEFIINLANKY
tara:strand:- start:3961 stop:4209 length:249 start_codon:yes stop_codon:yes gene_type:complete